MVTGTIAHRLVRSSTTSPVRWVTAVVDLRCDRSQSHTGLASTRRLSIYSISPTTSVGGQIAGDKVVVTKRGSAQRVRRRSGTIEVTYAPSYGFSFEFEPSGIDAE